MFIGSRLPVMGGLGFFVSFVSAFPHYLYFCGAGQGWPFNGHRPKGRFLEEEAGVELSRLFSSLPTLHSLPIVYNTVIHAFIFPLVQKYGFVSLPKFSNP